MVALTGLCAAILALFHRDAADMASIWWHSSTFTHCLLMVPMIGWLVAQRAGQLKTLTPAWCWPALVWIGGAGLVWLVGEAAGVALFRQLGLILMLQGAVAATLGEKLVRGLLFRSEEHTSELQSLMRISYAFFCLKKKKTLLIDIISYSYH